MVIVDKIKPQTLKNNLKNNLKKQQLSETLEFRSSSLVIKSRF